MAAALAPAATMARHKLRMVLPQRKPNVNPADQLEDMKRWSPVAATSQTADSAAD
jgi:hypothetical protein